MMEAMEVMEVTVNRGQVSPYHLHRLSRPSLITYIIPNGILPLEIDTLNRDFYM